MPAPQPDLVSHRQGAGRAVPRWVPSITETITSISDALNVSRRVLAPEGVPARADPGPAGEVRRQERPRQEAGPGEGDGAAGVQGDRGEKRAQITRDASGDQECGGKSTSSPSSERQMPGPEGEGARKAERTPPRDQETRGTAKMILGPTTASQHLLIKGLGV